MTTTELYTVSLTAEPRRYVGDWPGFGLKETSDMHPSYRPSGDDWHSFDGAAEDVWPMDDVTGKALRAKTRAAWEAAAWLPARVAAAGLGWNDAEVETVGASDGGDHRPGGMRWTWTLTR